MLFQKKLQLAAAFRAKLNSQLLFPLDLLLPLPEPLLIVLVTVSGKHILYGLFKGIPVLFVGFLRTTAE